jgi:hypothetical protein
MHHEKVERLGVRDLMRVLGVFPQVARAQASNRKSVVAKKLIREQLAVGTAVKTCYAGGSWISVEVKWDIVELGRDEDWGALQVQRLR